MMRFVFIVLLCSVHLPGKAQQISGRIIDADSKVPIPFVNISIKNTYKGTVSDTEGNYLLNIPKQFTDGTICFSCIGYESLEMITDRLRKSPDITLTKADVHLSEVTIMPDSTLRSFLRKAYEKIPDNYPNFPTQYEAFYREGIQNEGKEYIRLVEAITKANKSSYKNAQSGTVQLIDSRKYIDADSSNAFPISFYGGPHFIHELDCVKKRYYFLKPHTNYEYSYLGLTKYNDELVHQISFQPKDGRKDELKGTMYIHAETLSYLRFDLQSTEIALDKRFDGLFNSSYGLKSLNKTYNINYQLSDSLCFLKSIFENEKLQTKEGDIYYSPLEMVITKSKISNVVPIPFNFQIQHTYVPDREATDYLKSDWRDYKTLAEVQVIDTIVTKDVFNNQQQQTNKGDKLLALIKKMELSYRIGYQPYQLSSGVRQLQYQSVGYERSLVDAGTTTTLDMLFAYRLSQRFNIGYIIEGGVGGRNLQEKHGPQMSYKFPLKTMGNNLFLQPQLAYVWHKYARSIGTQSFDEDFSFGGKKFKSSKVEALPGIKHKGCQVGASLLYQLAPMLYLDLGASYYMPSSTQDVLYLKEKSGFFLTRKTANEPLDETEATLSIDGVPMQSSGVSYDNWSLSFGIRMMY